MIWAFRRWFISGVPRIVIERFHSSNTHYLATRKSRRRRIESNQAASTDHLQILYCSVGLCAKFGRARSETLWKKGLFAVFAGLIQIRVRTHPIVVDILSRASEVCQRNGRRAKRTGGRLVVPNNKSDLIRCL